MDLAGAGGDGGTGDQAKAPGLPDTLETMGDAALVTVALTPPIVPDAMCTGDIARDEERPRANASGALNIGALGLDALGLACQTPEPGGEPSPVRAMPLVPPGRWTLAEDESCDCDTLVGDPEAPANSWDPMLLCNHKVLAPGAWFLIGLGEVPRAPPSCTKRGVEDVGVALLCTDIACGGELARGARGSAWRPPKVSPACWCPSSASTTEYCQAGGRMASPVSSLSPGS